MEYLVYNELLYITLQLTNNNLVLQVYCSLSLKEHLHNPVMTLLARNNRGKNPSCVDMVVCMYVCGVVCECTCLCIACECVRYICVCISIPVHSEWWIQIYKVYMYQ